LTSTDPISHYVITSASLNHSALLQPGISKSNASRVEDCLEMKLAPLSYHLVDNVTDALVLLERYSGDAKLIAGGQSLMPMLAYRLLAPAALIDIGRIHELKSIHFDADSIRIGACVRWCEMERHAGLSASHPLLHNALGHIAHYQVRNRGTAGGSLAHADPAAEFPAVVLACGGVVEIRSKTGTRFVEADDFFQGLLSTVLKDDEVLVSVTLPRWPSHRRWGFKEFARRRGDFALAGVALHFGIQRGRVVDPHIVGFGVADRPVILREAQAVLDGTVPDAKVIARASGAAREAVEPPDDRHAPSEYRRSLLGTLVERALTEAIAREREPA
jgi:aerobic carbon-monoxide dehydrogenase medium subunit